jgi:hypothetical protein
MNNCIFVQVSILLKLPVLMTLKYQSQIDSIDNCPLDECKGEKILFRFVENPMTTESFEPHAIIYKPKYHNLCIGWGLSMFVDLKSAKETLNSLSLKMQQKIVVKSIASGLITDNDGVKCCTKNKNHYTFFPKQDIDLISRFEIVDEDE